MCCDELQPVLRYRKLSMLFEARAACLRFRMWEREGKGRGRWKEEEEGTGGERGKKVSRLQIVWIRDGCFNLFLATTLHTVAQLLEG